ncbi:hypothetical protein OKW40_003368 [Paraburkholderia sp. RAU6.4a]
MSGGWYPAGRVSGGPPFTIHLAACYIAFFDVCSVAHSLGG